MSDERDAVEQQEDQETIDDIVGDLLYGDDLSPAEDEENTGDTDSTGDDVQSGEQSDADSREDEDEEGSDDSESGSKDGEGEDAKKGEDEDKDDESEDDDDGEPMVEIDGERVPLSEVREWRQNGLRQSDFTRKSQQREEQYRQWQEQAQARDTLVNDLVSDESMKEFLAAHPEAITYLLQDPENARKLLGNPKEIQGFWDDYEVLTQNPGLLERLRPERPEEVEEAVVQQRIRDNVMTVANALDAAVDNAASDFEGVDPEQVKDYVLSLGNYPAGDEPDPAAVVASFERLYGLFFEQTDEGLRVNDTLIRNEFDRLSAHAKLGAGASSEEEEAEEHNKAVDEQLQDVAPPATPGSGNAPVPQDELEPEADSLESVIGDLLYGDDA